MPFLQPPSISRLRDQLRICRIAYPEARLTEIKEE